MTNAKTNEAQGRTMAKRWQMYVAAAVTAVSMVGCGGGGGGGGDSLFEPPPGGETPTAASLILTADKSVINNAGSDRSIVTITALDAANNVVSGAAVNVSADSDAVVSKSTPTTGADGTLTGTVSIGENKSNRVVTVTASVGSITKTLALQVQGAELSSSLSSTVLAPGADGTVRYRLVDSVGNAMVGFAYTVTGAGLEPAESTGTTDDNGEFIYAFTGPDTGSYTIVASAGGADPTSNVVQVQAAATVDPVTVAITSASVSANPSVVAINQAGSDTSRSQIRALFLTTGNQPVRNVRVRFDLDGDANSIGGTFDTGSDIVYSDANGIAVATYIPGTRSSPTDGVTVRACYGGTDFAAGACPQEAIVRLTVSSEPLGVSIGTNELIIVNELTYVKKFLVTVVDSAGVAIPDVNISVSVDLSNYRKGFYAVPTDGEEWVRFERAVCTSEDANRNGVLEDSENRNGISGGIPLNVPGTEPPVATNPPEYNNRLEPGKSDVSVTLLQSRTRADGTVELQVQYAKSFGSWVDAVITVAASGVSGTEGRASYVLPPVPVDTESLKDVDVPPAYRLSPYGILPGCTNPN